jgi:hypothetical protein
MVQWRITFTHKANTHTDLALTLRDLTLVFPHTPTLNLLFVAHARLDFTEPRQRRLHRLLWLAVTGSLRLPLLSSDSIRNTQVSTMCARAPPSRTLLCLKCVYIYIVCMCVCVCVCVCVCRVCV